MAKRILIIKPSALGDIVLALPALSSLRASFPDAKISWFVRKEFAPLIEGNDNLDEVIIFDRKLLGKWWCHPKAFGALVRLVKGLRSCKFDIVIDLQGLFRTALFGWFSGCKRRYGMATAREFATVLYTDKVAFDEESVHLIDCNYKMLAAAGATVRRDEYGLNFSDGAEKSVSEKLDSVGVEAGGYAVFVPSAAQDYKCWPVENFAKLAEKIVSEYGLKIIAVGTAGEKGVVERLESLSSAEVIDFCGRTDIPELAALIKGAGLVISNDTGPGHIAAATGAAMVMIFGATNPSRVGPYGRGDAVGAVDAFERGSDIESRDAAHSVEAVTVEQVFEKVKCQLGRKAL